MELKEILLKALKLETDGREFYLRAAGITRNAEAQAMFGRLASEEQHHYNFIKRQYDALEGGKGLTAIPELDRVSRLDIAAPIFPKNRTVPETLPDNPSEEDALLFALGAEMKSYTLYREAAKQAAEPEAQQMFLQLTSAELGHFNTLMQCHEASYGYPR